MVSAVLPQESFSAGNWDLTGLRISIGDCCEPSEQALVNDMLYFGTAKPGGIVSAREWATFLGSVVTPRFPAGLTSWTASGQWRYEDGTLTLESSHVLNLLHAPGSATEAAIREVIAEYKSQFKQEAVLRVKSHACVSF